MVFDVGYAVKFGSQLEKQEIIDTLRIVVYIEEDIRHVWIKSNRLTHETFVSITGKLDNLTDKGVLHPDINAVYRKHLGDILKRESEKTADVIDWMNALRTQIVNTLAK